MDATEQQRRQLIDDIQTLPAEVLQEIVDLVSHLRQKEAASETEQPSKQVKKSPYESFKEAGLIGCIKDAPSDLSVNYKKYISEYLEEKYPRYALDGIPQPSLQEIAQLPVDERHLLLAQQVADTAADFANDPALTEFAEIDLGDWSANDVGA